jgi:hypothetical protein
MGQSKVGSNCSRFLYDDALRLKHGNQCRELIYGRRKPTP